MKTKLLIVAVLTFISSNSLIAQTWQWAREEAATPEGYGVCCDNSGNAFLTGYVTGINVFGSFTVAGGPGLNGAIIKYDPNGNVLWANGFNGGYGYAVYCDATG